MKSFEYTHAESVAQALVQLRTPGVVAKAGGVDLLDRMKEGLEEPARVVDLSTVPGLDRVQLGDDGAARIGALVTLARLESDEGLRARWPAVVEAAAHAATPQLRALATLGGNLAQRPRCWYFRSADFPCKKKGGAICFAQHGENELHAIFDNAVCAIIHPSTVATALVAYDAQVVIAAAGGERVVPLEKFFVSSSEDPTRETVLGRDELITEVRLPAAAGARAAYLKLGHRDSYDWPLAEVAVVLEPGAGGACKRASIVLGAAASVPRRAVAAERALVGHVVDDETAAAAARAAIEGATPLDKNGYKLRLFETVVRRAVLASSVAAPAAGGAR